MVERTVVEQNKEKRIKINENRLRDLSDHRGLRRERV